MQLLTLQKNLLLWNLCLLGVNASFKDHDPTIAHRNIPRLGSKFWPVPDNDDDDKHRMSIANMTCDFFTQPLNHFVPRGKSPTYPQRYCVYDGYAAKDPRAPIFFYTGNESPLEQYINHTGLIWELAPQFHARIVFAEHRYEGQSLPLPNLTKDCLSYGSTIQALADYADLLQLYLNPHPVENTTTNTNHPMAPVIVFGGSYGGMLSAWMRMKYPHLVAGAIAASAPLGAFPQSANDKMDGSARVLAHGLQQSYPPDKKEILQEDHDNDEENHCLENLRASWPLITWLVQSNDHHRNHQEQDVDTDDAGTFLQDVFRLCEPYTNSDPEPLLDFATSLWFDLAEGSFPYPSSYIPFALLHKNVKLPAWPMQAACWTSRLYQNWGIVVQGDLDQVLYNVSYGDSGLVLQIDWDTVTAVSSPSSSPKVKALSTSRDIVGLLSSVREAISIWYNITKDVECYDVTDTAPNKGTTKQGWTGPSTMRLSSSTNPKHETTSRQLKHSQSSSSNSRNFVEEPAQTCQEKIRQVGSWEPVCCNDEINLVVTEARGLGRDFFWPPSLPRGVRTYSDMVKNLTMGSCPDPDGIFGYSTENYDPMSTWLDTYFGSSNLQGHSNIIFSNGLLDPWAAGGVYSTDDPTQRSSKRYDGPMIQNITDNNVIALIIEYGGHHTDLMYSHPADPSCVTKAREVEKAYITKWIDDWYSNDDKRKV